MCFTANVQPLVLFSNRALQALIWRIAAAFYWHMASEFDVKNRFPGEIDMLSIALEF